MDTAAPNETRGSKAPFLVIDELEIHTHSIAADDSVERRLPGAHFATAVAQATVLYEGSPYAPVVPTLAKDARMGHPRRGENRRLEGWATRPRQKI